MKCPVCSNHLVEYDSGEFHVDICRDGCSGIWFDVSELERCDKMDEPFPEDLLIIRKSQNVVIDRSKPRFCPRCPEKVELKALVIDPVVRFELDEGPKCHGDWLDVGELGNLRKKEKFESDLEKRLQSYSEQAERNIDQIDSTYRVTGLLRKLLCVNS